MYKRQLLLEAGFFLCAFYLEYYDWRSYNEFNQGSRPSTLTENKIHEGDAHPSQGSRSKTLKGLEKHNGAATPSKASRTLTPTLVKAKRLHPVPSSIKKKEGESNSQIETVLERKCLNCQSDISHKRKDAKFCDAKCRKKGWAN